MRISTTTVLALVMLVTPGIVRAQDGDLRLQAALALAQGGDSDSARAEVQRLLATLSPGDAAYPEALYTAGLIAASVDEAERYFRRVALEYSLSDWADDAILRSAQLKYAAHDIDGTLRAINQLYADYRSSPVMASGAYWAARASIDKNENEAACRWIGIGLSFIKGDVETANQLNYLAGRCGDLGGPAAAEVVPRPPPVPAQAAPADPVTPPAPTPPAYRVQVAAVSNQQAAEQIVDQLRQAGYQTVLVNEGGLYKVRAGGYGDRESADAAVQAIRSLIGGNPFVVTGQ